ncbi:MAG: histidine kinase dimerization/phospho-acceptor domain-containing protein [Thiobacillus sp.]|uniref:ATP-binding protein n=1 Tax=Thiobacillus sp. TaxID=924 RepID=UPI0028949471|nr:ATP-binding protein [Thiobacillus sp.]MDT3707038.1 histidine kinase dimerization/phospho-acceptor domain-containing protein [Thiobacillus sp.]
MSQPAPYSLRRRLVWLLTSAVALIWLVAAVLVYQRTHHEADELLDTQLTQVADTLLAIVAGGEVDHFVKELREHADHGPVPIAFEVWHNDDGKMRRLATSPGHETFVTGMSDGFSEHPHQGARWRFYTVQDDDAEYRVVVGQAHAARESLAREIGLSLLIPAVLALPLMALAMWWGVGRSLRPVETLARQVGALDAQALAPIDDALALPNEIAPLRAALNALIQRVNKAFENERRFTADAAHELRTPLAALKVQAQVALRAQTVDSQQRALAQVIAGVDRMTHLVEQLLTLARVDPASQGATPQPLDPAEIITDVGMELLPQAQRQGQTLVVDAAPGCRIAVTAAWLRIAVRNLLDNALRYAGEGARVEVRLVCSGSSCAISVADDGPGVAPALRSQLSARFVRGEVEGDGCGLGLSIVSRIAALSHARLELGDGLRRADGGHGFAATLRFTRVSGRNE